MANLTNLNNKFLVTTGGNVGIGTTSPGQKLEVAGRIRVTTDPTIEFYEASNKRGGVQWDATNDWVNMFAVGGDIRFDIGGEKMRITSAGNVGIGTDAPGSKLHVKGDFVSIEDPSGGYKMELSADTDPVTIMSDNLTGAAYGQIAFVAGNGSGSNDQERMRIDSSGDLTMQGGRIYVKESDLGNTAVAITRDADEGYVQLFSSGSQTIEIRGNGNSYFNGGNIGIGTTSPSAKLHVASSAADNLVLKLEQDNASHESWFEANSQDGGYFRAGISTDANNFAFFNTDQGSYRWFGAGGASPNMTLTNGNLGIGTTSPLDKVHSVGGYLSTDLANPSNTNTGSVQLGYDGTRGILRTWNSSPLQLNAYNNIEFNTSGSERMLITSAGNVQIGSDSTATPELLTVQAYTQNQAFSGKYSSSGYLWFLRHEANNSGRFQLFNAGSTTINLEGNTTRDNYILGDVGIGTTNPSSALEVVDSTNYKGIHIRGNAAPNLTFGQNLDSTAEWKIGISGFNGDSFSIGTGTGANDKLHITSAGDVGIATTSPAQKLDVRGGNIMVGGFGGGTDYGLILTPDDGSGYWNIANVTGGALTFNNSNTIGSSEAMRITGGNVGINTTAPYGRLDVNGTVTIGPANEDPAVTLTETGDDVSLTNSGGSIEINVPIQGTTTNGCTLTFTYAKASWASWVLDYEFASTAGLVKGVVGGYNNGSTGHGNTFIIENFSTSVAVAAVGSGSQHVQVTFTFSSSMDIHPFARFIYSQGGADGRPRADRVTVAYVEGS